MIIQVTLKSVYGNELLYPVNPPAKALAELTGKRTLSLRDLRLARNSLGHTIEVLNTTSEYVAHLLAESPT